MFRRRLRAIPLIVATAAAMLAAACQQPPSAPAYQPPSFADRAPIRLDVARIDVVNEYAAPARAPNVDHLFKVTPAAAAAGWARDRLRAVGAAGAARVVIRNASVVEAKLPREGGIRGALTTQQSERYDAVLEVRVEIADDRGTQRAMVSSRAERSRTVPEDVTLEGREKAWHEMTTALMNDLDIALERQIRDNFGSFLR